MSSLVTNDRISRHALRVLSALSTPGSRIDLGCTEVMGCMEDRLEIRLKREVIYSTGFMPSTEMRLLLEKLSLSGIAIPSEEP